MKKFFASILVAMALSGLCRADSVYTPDQPTHLITFFTNSAGPSIVLTNETVEPWKLSSLIVWLPALTTNLTTVSIVEEFDEGNQYKGWQVETNDFSQVVTNFYNTITNTAYSSVTSSVFTVGSSNETTVISDTVGTSPRIPDDFWVMPGDVMTFGFTYTNTVQFRYTGVR